METFVRSMGALQYRRRDDRQGQKKKDEMNQVPQLERIASFFPETESRRMPATDMSIRQKKKHICGRDMLADKDLICTQGDTPG